MAASRKGEPAYENRLRNRPISGGRDLSCVRFERLPELHSASAAGGHRWTIHGCPVCLALFVGDLSFSGHRRGASAGQPLRAVGGGRAGAGDRQHPFFPRFDGPERASAGPVRGRTLGSDLRRRPTSLCRVVPVALEGASLKRGGIERQPRGKRRTPGARKGVSAMTNNRTILITGVRGNQ